MMMFWMFCLALVGLVVWRFFWRRRTPRRWAIGASSIAAAIGVHPYKTQLELFEEMTGLRERSEQGKEAKDHGIANESRALSVYQTLYESDVVDGNKYGMLLSPSMPWLRGYADGLVYQGGELVGVLEIKCRYAAPGKEAVPYQNLANIFYYLPQVQAYMEMTGTQWCDLMSYTERGSTVFRVARDEELFYLISLALSRFRDCLLRQVPPPLDEHQVRLADQIKERLLRCEWQVPAPLEYW